MLSVLLSTKFCNYLLCLRYCRAPKNDLLMEANAKTSEPTSFWRTNSWLFQSVICVRKWRHTMKRKSRTKWRKIHLYFHVYLKIIVWIFHFITVFRKHTSFCDKEMASCSMWNRVCWHSALQTGARECNGHGWFFTDW